MVFGFVNEVYDNLVLVLPDKYQLIPPLIAFAVLISIYGFFVFFFYKYMAKRDIVKLDLEKYNKFEHPTMLKFFAVILYIVEFLFVIPLSIVAWFAILSIMLLFLAKGQTIQTIILISAALIAAIRITSYFAEDLSKDLAKMVPFTLLGVVLLSPTFFDFSTTISKVNEIPALLSAIVYVALFIVLIEIVLRLFYSLYAIIVFKEESEKEEEQ